MSIKPIIFNSFLINNLENLIFELFNTKLLPNFIHYSNKIIQMKKLYFICLIAILVLTLACNDSPPKEKQSVTLSAPYKTFNEKFTPLSLPYKMETDNKNYAAFTALLTENHHIDSSFRNIFTLDSLTKEKSVDSILVHAAAKCCQFYHVGKVYETSSFSVILYARNNFPPHDDIYIFLATMDKDGKKIDEILFHKPESILPPAEINRISTILADSTIHLSKLTSDYQFVADKEKANLHRQILHEKSYKINSLGKIALLKEENKEIPLK